MTAPLLLPHPSHRSAPGLEPLAEAMAFATEMSSVHRASRRSRRTVPTEAEKSHLVGHFWRLIETFRRHELRVAGDEDALRATQVATRELLNPWLLRSEYW